MKKEDLEIFILKTLPNSNYKFVTESNLRGTTYVDIAVGLNTIIRIYYDQYNFFKIIICNTVLSLNGTEYKTTVKKVFHSLMDPYSSTYTPSLDFFAQILKNWSCFL